MTLQERVKSICESHNIQSDHIDWYIKNLSPDAIANNELFTEEMIWNSIISRELFWGLGDAIMNYVKWESSQV